jgi:hypothetical protein
MVTRALLASAFTQALLLRGTEGSAIDTAADCVVDQGPTQRGAATGHRHYESAPFPASQADPNPIAARPRLHRWGGAPCTLRLASALFKGVQFPVQRLWPTRYLPADIPQCLALPPACTQHECLVSHDTPPRPQAHVLHRTALHCTHHWSHSAAHSIAHIIAYTQCGAQSSRCTAANLAAAMR